MLSTEFAQAVSSGSSDVAHVIFLLGQKLRSGRRSWGVFVFSHSHVLLQLRNEVQLLVSTVHINIRIA